MKTSTALILLLHLSLNTVDEGFAINPSCSCIRFTSPQGKERGTFSSPDYPRPYPRALCLLYTFIAQPHQIVELVFTDFDVFKEHLDCTHGDYLKVYSEVDIHGPGPPGIPGVNEYSKWSRVLCGNRNDAPPTLYSHGSALVLELNSGEKESNATGFIGTYKFIDRRNFETDGVLVADSECDYVFNSHLNKPSQGRFYSPRYPSSYHRNAQCYYHFNARKHERVKLVFEESFLQKGDESCLNRADTIKVFDGKVSSAPVIAMLCNEIVGYEILSTGSDLLVEFIAKSKTPGQGFKARYQFQPNENIIEDADKKTNQGTSVGPAVSATTSSCDQEFRSDKSTSGKLISPLYPAPYPPKTHCHYDFLARGRQRVRLVFEDFSLQRVTGTIIDCESMDSLDVFLDVDGRLEKMASFCGSDVPKAIMSNGPKLAIDFRGVYSSRYSRGFKISYYFVEDYGITAGKQLLEYPCAFVYNSSARGRGVVTSPNHPGLYPRDTECNYFFYGTHDQKVHLHFSHFDVEGVHPCEVVSASDYVQFSNEVNSRGTRHCGQLKDLKVTSKRNFFRMTFRSNDRLDGTGFKANYIFLKDTELNTVNMPSIGGCDALFHTTKITVFLLILDLIVALR
ncbi:suppressor of lurcher protein 1-like [Colias croceus]|uniref:suppressor of lurcher protein 1-like n=1 Tax=Colias crocea TaxID=72248 RepID=UPI001E281966|nr:suppressor of lurcher protein 1-like [Colias croceus]